MPNDVVLTAEYYDKELDKWREHWAHVEDRLMYMDGSEKTRQFKYNMNDLIKIVQGQNELIKKLLIEHGYINTNTDETNNSVRSGEVREESSN